MMNTNAKGPPRPRLAAERTRRRWTQLEVADQLGTTPGNVSRWERGITSPGPYFRCKLSELFGRSAHELGLTWEACEDPLAQGQTLLGPGTTLAPTQVQAHPGRDGISKAQTATESASRYRDGSARVFCIKAHPCEVGDENLAPLAGGLNRPEHGQERLVRLHIHSDWGLVLDTVAEVRLVVDVLLSGRQSTLTTIVCPKQTGQR